MNKLIAAFAIICLTISSANAQNAFYDAKYIMSWYVQPDSVFLAHIDTSNSIRQRNISILDSINAKIQSYYYSDAASISFNPPDSVLRFKKISEIYSKLDEQYLKLLGVDQIFLTYIIDTTRIPSFLKINFPGATKAVGEYLRDSVSFKTKYPQIDAIRNEFKSTADASIKQNDSTLLVQYKIDSTNNSNNFQKKKMDFASSLLTTPTIELGKLITSTRNPSSTSALNFAITKNYSFQNLVKTVQADNATAAVSQPTATLSNPIGISQSEAIDALAILMVTKFKQEVALTFVDLLRQKMEKDSLLQDLFKNTISILSNSEKFELPRFGKVWSHALAEDFYAVTESLANSEWVKNKVNSSDTTTKELFKIFQDVVFISKLAMQQESLPDIVTQCYLDTSALKSKLTRKYINLCYIINSQLYDTATSTYWLNWNAVSKMTPGQWELLGNLISIKYGADFRSLFDSAKLDHDSSGYLTIVKNYICKVLSVLNTFEKNQKAIFSSPAVIGTGNYVPAINFWDLQSNLLEVAFDNHVLSSLPKNIDQFLLIAKNSIQIYKLIQQKNYAAVLHEAVGLLDILLPKPTNRIQELFVAAKFGDNYFLSNKTVAETILTDLNKLSAVFDSARLYYTHKLNKDSIAFYITPIYRRLFQIPAVRTSDTMSLSAIYLDIITTLKNHSGANEILVNSSPDSLATLLSSETVLGDGSHLASLPYQKSRFLDILEVCEFLTDVMAAKNSQDLSNAIGSYSAPPNSYKIKRNTRESWDINGYFGAYIGDEFIPTASGNGPSGAVVYGFTAPIGVTYSWGISRGLRTSESPSFINKKAHLEKLVGNCWSVSLTLIDIAAVVSYRFENGTSGQLPTQINFAQIFSPGLHLQWGIKNTPFCLSAGAEYTPQLRNLDTEASRQQQHATRIYGGLFFDIPLYNISYK